MADKLKFRPLRGFLLVHAQGDHHVVDCPGPGSTAPPGACVELRGPYRVPVAIDQQPYLIVKDEEVHIIPEED